MTQISKALITTLLLVAAYSAWVALVPAQITVPQGMNQDNAIKSQDFIYEQAKGAEAVILGSSLAAKMKIQMMPNSYANLGFRGQSVYEGCEILKRAQVYPKTIFIETNVLARPINWATINGLLHPVSMPVKGWLPIMQEKNQPVNRLFHLGVLALEKKDKKKAEELANKLGARTSGTIYIPTEKDMTEKKDTRSEELLAKLMADLEKKNEEAPKAEVFEANMKRLHAYLDLFESKGCKVIFFEMPSHPMACDNVRLKYVRQVVEQNFPKTKYTYYPQPDCNAYSTSDGRHLTEPSSYRYTKYFLETWEGMESRMAGVR